MKKIINIIYNMPNALRNSHFSKIAFFVIISVYLFGCGQPDPSDWYSYNTRDRHSASVRVLSAEIHPPNPANNVNKDIVRIKMEWRNDDNERITIDDEKFSLNVSGVRLNPEFFEDVVLDPGQTLEQQYDFLVLSSFVDKAKYKLSLEDYAEIPVTPVRTNFR